MWVSWQWQRAHCNKREGNSHHYCLEMIGCGFRHVSSPISHWTKPYQHPPTAGCWFSGEENCSLSKVVVMAFCLKIEIAHMESSLLKLCFMMSQHLGCQCSIVCFSVDAGGGDGINTLHNLANNTTLGISPREYWIKRILITKKAFRFVILNTEMWCNDKTY